LMDLYDVREPRTVSCRDRIDADGMHSTWSRWTPRPLRLAHL
jgi:hypothetical protein